MGPFPSTNRPFPDGRAGRVAGQVGVRPKPGHRAAHHDRSRAGPGGGFPAVSVGRDRTQPAATQGDPARQRDPKPAVRTDHLRRLAPWPADRVREQMRSDDERVQPRRADGPILDRAAGLGPQPARHRPPAHRPRDEAQGHRTLPLPPQGWIGVREHGRPVAAPGPGRQADPRRLRPAGCDGRDRGALRPRRTSVPRRRHRPVEPRRVRARARHVAEPPGRARHPRRQGCDRELRRDQHACGVGGWRCPAGRGRPTVGRRMSGRYPRPGRPQPLRHRAACRPA